MKGSKTTAKRSWARGRGPNSLRAEMRRSIKVNKRRLSRKARHSFQAAKGSSFKKLAGIAAYDLTT